MSVIVNEIGLMCDMINEIKIKNKLDKEQLREFILNNYKDELNEMINLFKSEIDEKYENNDKIKLNIVDLFLSLGIDPYKNN